MKKKVSLLSVMVEYFCCGVYILAGIICLTDFITDALLEKSTWILAYDHLKFALLVMLMLYSSREGKIKHLKYTSQQKEKNKQPQEKQLLND